MRNVLIGAKAFALVILSSVAAHAMNISYEQFGHLDTSFGGTGIPNHAVAIDHFTTTVGNQTYAGTLGLTVHQRYDNPPVNNNGAGVFGAVTGGDGAHGQPGYARWNLGVHYATTPGRNNAGDTESGWSVRLYYDLDPAANSPLVNFIQLEPSLLTGPQYSFQNSLNLGMQSIFGPGFNPTIAGEHGIGLEFLQGTTVIGKVYTVVHTSENGEIPTQNVPDGGATVGMLALGMLGITGFRKKMQR